VQRAVREARPEVLEPTTRIAITAPAGAAGAITGDLSLRRGSVRRTDTPRPGRIAITAQVPLAELASYQARLDLITAGQGVYTLALSHYEIVLPQAKQQLAGQYKTKQEECAELLTSYGPPQLRPSTFWVAEHRVSRALATPPYAARTPLPVEADLLHNRLHGCV